MTATTSPLPVHEKKPRSLQDAEKEFEKYKKIEEDLLAELEALVTKVEEEEAGVGDRILAARLSGEGEDRINQEVTQTWLQMDTTRKALKSATRARTIAEANILHARADEKKEEAAVLRQEVSTRMERTNKLLQELRGHEGVLYQAPIPVHSSGAGYEYDKPPTKSGEIMMRAIELETEAKRLDEEAARIRQRAQAEYEKKGVG
ncbi:MAG: hypothetical protein WC502_09185 [Methanolinea sp.]